ncbi:hypothetical protein A2459_04000 [Candidatus Roizmanbacteria bacterium RIFOXYC2_FULL_41_10]|nr:MAG: hypothetical protein A2459_04000 [Candidatus Roizmanbacteria bacterium RIFOXYC2_FULL_41_10]
MINHQILLSKPIIDKHEEKAVLSVLRSGQLVQGPQVKKLEIKFSKLVGAKYALAVNNGTSALHTALQAVGIGLNDEVITTPFTAIPTISAIVLAGGRPVFVDIDSDTYIMDIKRVASVVTERTCAIMPVHLFAQMADIEKLKALLPRPIPVIEDACQAHGCKMRGKQAGSLGELAAFSFYPTKNIGGYGDGGAIVTNSDDYNERLRLMRNYGKKTQDLIVLDGGNSRLDEIQAAILQLKLRDLEKNNTLRKEVVEWYCEGLKGTPLRMPIITEECEPNWHVFVVKVPEVRNELKDYLMQNGIQTDVFYPYPHHLQPAYSHLGYAAGDFPEAEAVGREVLALPMYPQITCETVQTICRVIRAFWGQS